jgi:hypothetical protein
VLISDWRTPLDHLRPKVLLREGMKRPRAAINEGKRYGGNEGKLFASSRSMLRERREFYEWP